MTEWYTAGKVRMTPKGTHNSTTPYEVLDLVSNNTKTIYYIAKQNVPTGVSLENSNYWDVIMNVSDSDAGALEDLKQYVREMSPLKTVGPSGTVSAEDAAPLDVEGMEIQIEPVQDLHGYDSPWPAMGGKNLLPVTASTSTTNGITFTVNADGTITANGTASADAYLKIGTATVSSGTYTISTGYGIDNTKFARVFVSGTTSTPVLRTDFGNVPSATLDGAYDVYIYVTNGTTISNGKFSVQLELGSTATTYAPYSNICPITGWTGVQVTRTGKNLLNPAQYGQTLPFTSHGVTITEVGNGVYHAQGTATDQIYWNVTFVNGQLTTRAMPAAPFIGKNLYISVTGTADIIPHLNYFKSDWTFTSIPNGSMIPTDARAVRCFLLISSGTTINTDFSAQLEIGSAPTAHEPYQGDTYTISFPVEAGTVYGGTLDVTNGILTVDRAMVTEEAFAIYGNSSNVSSGGLRWFNSQNLAFAPATGEQGISSMLRWVNNGWATATPCIDSVNAGQIRIYDDSSSNESFRAKYSGLKVVYRLATPVTYALTPAGIALLRGYNTLFADAGNVELSYRQDVALLLTKLSTQVSALNNAVANS